MTSVSLTWWRLLSQTREGQEHETETFIASGVNSRILAPDSRCRPKRPRQKLVMRDSRNGLPARSEQDFLAWSEAHEELCTEFNFSSSMVIFISHIKWSLRLRTPRGPAHVKSVFHPSIATQMKQFIVSPSSLHGWLASSLS